MQKPLCTLRKSFGNVKLSKFDKFGIKFYLDTIYLFKKQTEMLKI